MNLQVRYDLEVERSPRYRLARRFLAGAPAKEQAKDSASLSNNIHSAQQLQTWAIEGDKSRVIALAG